jgi:CheY-like chemotaxis protein
MTTEKYSVLVVDDQRTDAAIIARATRICLDLLGLKSEFSLASNVHQAETTIAERPPNLIITDLFMPEDDFSELESQCNEMELPRGLEFLQSMNGQLNVQKLVTTFFWNYPGFSRYSEAFRNLKIDGVLPKDIFYLVGTLAEPSMANAAEFPPLRILIQALGHLLVNPPNSIKEMRHLHFRSLFDESSAWLSSQAHQVLEIRNGVKVESAASTGEGKIKRASAAARKPYEPWGDSGEIAEQTFSTPWMPTFKMESANAGGTVTRGMYASLMTELEGDNWRIHIQVPSTMEVSDLESREPITWEGEAVELAYHGRDPKPPIREGFLSPRSSGREDRYHAQLLVTLGFFSYWCHLPDQRAARTPGEIAAIISTRTGNSYRNITDIKKIADKISDDLDVLNLKIQNKIRTEYHNTWWRFLWRSDSSRVIGVKRGDRSQYYYWLNASLKLRGVGRRT